MGESNVEPSADSVDPQSNTNGERSEPPGNFGVPPQIPPAVEHKRETTYGQPDKTPLWKIALEVGAVAVGIVVAMIYYGQLSVMRGQLGEIIRQFPEIQKSADANVKAADQTEKAVNNAAATFRLDERAWLQIANSNVTYTARMPMEARLWIKNTGKTPAFHVTVETDFGVKGEPANAKRKFEKSKAFHTTPVGVLTSNGEVLIGAFAGDSPNVVLSYPDEKIMFAVQGGAMAPYVFGTIRYTDMFDKKREHFLTFCYDLRLAAQITVPKAGPVTFLNQTPVLTNCGEHNLTDEE